MRAARTTFYGVAIAVSGFAVTVSAQQLMPAEPNESAIKFQVKNFESNLRLAVLKGGQEVVEKARKIVPSVDLQYVSDVEIGGWWTPDVGYIFDVTIPDIMPTSVNLFVWMQDRSIRTTPSAVSAASTSPKIVAGAGTMAPDPTTASPTVPFNPSREYSDVTRQALIDALVDYSGGLQIKSGQIVQIVAGPTPALMPNPLQPDSRKLILILKGDDLLAFRKGELKREDLIARIQERRF